MGTLYPVRFIRAWQLYGVGAVIVPPANLRDWLTFNGYVEPATAKPLEVKEQKPNEHHATSQARRGVRPGGDLRQRKSNHDGH